jgi:hypothetical protein
MAALDNNKSTSSTMIAPISNPPLAAKSDNPTTAASSLPADIDPELLKLLATAGMDKKKFLMMLDNNEANAAKAKQLTDQLAEKDRAIKQLSEEKKQQMREALKSKLDKLKMQFDDRDWADVDDLVMSDKPGYQKLVKFVTHMPNEETPPTPKAPPAKPETPPTPSSTTTSSSSTSSSSPTAPTAIHDASKLARQQMADNTTATKRKGKRDVPNADEDDEVPDSDEGKPLKKQRTIETEASDAKVEQENLQIALQLIRAAQSRARNENKSADEAFGGCQRFEGKRQ